MEYEHLITLSSALAAHVQRSDKTVAKRCGVHARLFDRLKAGKGCRVDTFNAAMRNFAAIWPDDLQWPGHVPRPDPERPNGGSEKRASSRVGGSHLITTQA